ncbi:MAG: hypothetical protein JWN46_3974 [Acidimicrobiales bacterium]|nr:hypothetical protein [Acidimicrobiales bacterium]
MPLAIDQWPLIGRQADISQFEAAYARPDGIGFLIHGPAGTGKSRLADECGRRAAAAGASVARVVASQAAASMPLGALAHLLPPDIGSSVDAAQVFDRARAEVVAAYEGRRPVLLVDDAHLLDASSALLLTQLAQADAVFLVATIRTGEAAPDAVRGWWRDERTLRVDLGDLDPDTVGELLQQVLDGPVSAEASRELAKASSGNVLLVRELVFEAIERGALVEVDGVWQLGAPISASRRVTEVLEDRLQALDKRARGVLDVVALCAPVSLSELEADVGAEVLEGLEAAGLIAVTTVDRRQQVSLTHPLYGECLRQQLPVLRARALLLRQADRLEASGARRREDALRVATWRLDANGQADPDLLLRAAKLARYAFDFRQVARLALAASKGAPSPEASLLLGEARYELGSFAEAEAALAEPVPPDTPEHIVLQRLLIRTKNLIWGLCNPARALELIEEFRPGFGPEARDELSSEEASLLVTSGNPRAALAVIARLGDTEVLRVRVLRALPEVLALAFVGRTSDAVAAAERGYADHLALGDSLAIAHPGSHVVSVTFALCEAGRLGEAEEIGKAGYEVTVADRVPIAQIWFAMNIGRANTLQGRPSTALRWYRESAAIARTHRFLGPLRMALTTIALASAMLDDGPVATAALQEAAELPPFGFLGPEAALAEGWTALALGDPERARAVLVAGAHAAEESGHLISASWLWHDAARLGAAGAAGPLASLAALTDSPLVATRAAHVAALEAHDAAGLAAAADGFVSIGALLLAAEAATAAADAARRNGDARAAVAHARQADELAAHCEGAHTPGLVRVDAVVPLSKREREVALLAAQNIPSRDIAERLFVSVRTVDNHLQRAYTKLGVSSRGELATALGLTNAGTLS